MVYKVLALKWRPQNFDQVIGQDHITQALKNAITFNRLSHAFTFSGPRGVGKTTTARILAKELNQIEDINSSFDVIEMDAASNRGIDEIRSLRENVSLAPAHGKYKIYIIDEVHMLTKEAFNALLKTLEEPPSHTIFILATTDSHKMPATILSRTQRYDFRRLGMNDIKKQLIIILKSEDKKFCDQSLDLIARKADGSMRDALGYLDQVINYCENEIDLKSVQKILGLVSDKIYLTIFDSISKGDVNNNITILNNIIMEGVSVHDFISGFNNFLRSLLHCKIGKDSNLEQEKWLQENSHIDELYIIRIMELILNFELKVKQLKQVDLALELLMIRLCNYHQFANISDILKDLSDNEKLHNVDFEQNQTQKSVLQVKQNKTVKKNQIDSHTSNVNEKSINETSVEKKTEKKEFTLEEILKKQEDIINYIDSKNSKVSSLLENMIIQSIRKYEITIKINNVSDFIYESILNGIDIIKDGFDTILNNDFKIIIKKGSKIELKNNNDSNKSKDEEHPLFMNVLEKFDGEIIR